MLRVILALALFAISGFFLSASKSNSVFDYIKLSPQEFQKQIYADKLNDELILKGPAFEMWYKAEELLGEKKYDQAKDLFIESQKIRPSLTSLAQYKILLCSQKSNDSLFVNVADSLLKIVANDFWRNKFVRSYAENVLLRPKSLKELDSSYKNLKDDYFVRVNKSSRDYMVSLYYQRQSKLLPDSDLADQSLKSLSQADSPKEAKNWTVDYVLGQKKLKNKLSNGQWHNVAWNLLMRNKLDEAEDAASEVNWSSYDKSAWSENQFWATWFWNSKNYKKAIKFYVKALEKNPKHENNLLQLARSYKNNDQMKESDSVYALFRATFPTHVKTSEMWWTMAQDFEQANQFDSAIWAYGKFDAKLSQDKRYPLIPLRIALVYLKQRQWEKALSTLQTSPSNSGSDIRGAMHFYSALAHYNLKNNDSAQVYFLKSITTFPLGWYGHRSRELLKTYDLIKDQDIPKIKPLDCNLKTTLMWARQLQKQDVASAWSMDVQEQIEVLLETQNPQIAWDLLQSEMIHWGKNADFLIFFAQKFHDAGEFNRSYRLARAAQGLFAVGEIPKAPRPFLELIFPFPYESFVRELTQKDALLNPYFIPAVARQESTFDPKIMSPAGAIGFMQIIPSTGRALAKKLKYENFEPEVLKNPAVAYTFGAQYLRDLLDEYKSPEWVLANYNAGPGPAKRWRKNGEDKIIDIAVEDISYWETRDYVKKVMANFWTYRAIYE
jgi:tetratricopeptide (TPR) repeat protein